ncbi:hypothetical protein [Mesorhizobium sp. Mes31]|uniref:hypothetical protein n=1 Tax=Mesorhizobium sp. Mes31 TaxID=2926017 RepID=UPI0021197694|nr:hypothetical protein [Mesorhizobium sp. Mes31]
MTVRWLSRASFALVDVPRLRDAAVTLEQFTVSQKRRTALTLCFDAIPNGKPLHTFPGIALSDVP